MPPLDQAYPPTENCVFNFYTPMSLSLRSIMRALAGISLFAWWAAAAHSQPGDFAKLRLVAMDGGQPWEHFAVERGEIVALTGDGHRMKLTSPRWRLTGDLKENARWFAFSPTCSIYTRPTATGENHFAIIRTGENEWSRRKQENGIVVGAWIFEGRPIAVGAVAANTNEDFHYTAIHLIAIPPGTESGAPATLLLTPQGFAPPPALFADPAAERAVEMMHVGSPQDFADTLDALKLMSSRTRGSGATLMHFAAEMGAVRATELLLARGAEPDPLDRYGSTPLEWAAVDGRRDEVNLLVGRMNRQSSGVAVKVWESAIDHGHLDLVVDRWKELTESARNQVVAAAARYGRADLLGACVAKSGSAACATVPTEILVGAIRRSNEPVVELLLDNGMKADSIAWDSPVLVLAAEAGNERAVTRLLTAGATVNATAKTGRSALMAAAARGDRLTVDRLLVAGADVELRDRSGSTALHLAAGAGRTEVVASLLRHGATVNARDKDGNTPLELALGIQVKSTVAELAGAGARLDPTKAEIGETLVRAIAVDAAELLQRAVSDGWEPKRVIMDELTAGDIAEIYGATRTRAYLRGLSRHNANVQPAVVVNPETPAKLLKPASFRDPRSADCTQPAVVAKVSGMVDLRGRFLLPYVTGCDDSLVMETIMKVVRSLQFAPARAQGRAVLAYRVLTLEFPGHEKEVFPAESVERPPVLKTRPKLESTNEIAPSYSNRTILMSSKYVDPNNSNSSGQMTAVQVPLAKPDLPIEVRYRWGDWAGLSFVVEPDGGVGQIDLLDASSATFGFAAAEALAAFRFDPGRKQGPPVRTRVDIVLRPDA